VHCNRLLGTASSHRNPLWAVLPGAPPDDEPVTAEDVAAIEDGRQQRGMTMEEFRAETA
jgi:hypothetical protein